MEALTRPIVLLTDFGTRDQYVGQVKAVIAGIAPASPLIDLFHDVEPYAIDEGAWVLHTSLPLLPANAVVLAVVDPGVGSVRRPLVVSAGGRHFVGPDNGLLSAALQLPGEVRELSTPAWRRPLVSHTFHARDIFGPAAAHLAIGEDVRRAGPPVSDALGLPLFEATPRAMGELHGYVIHVDRYGSLITTVRSHQLFPRFTIEVGGRVVDERVHTFADAAAGRLFCHADSSGFIAIAMNQASAAAELGVRRGDAVVVRSK